MATRILIVEDDLSHRKSLLGLLEEEGYECEEASNGGEGLAILMSNHFDIVLTDYSMPILNGLQLLDNMNQRNILSSTATILMSGQLKSRNHTSSRTIWRVSGDDQTCSL
ncbi:MAG: response regulator [Nitrospirae bacterium]|nr:response regulator [Nitrospirota bacterium]